MDLFKTIEEIKKLAFRAPLAVWEDFERGHIWDDMQKEIQCWLADTWSCLEKEEDPVEAAHLRGRARALREVLQMPENIILVLQDKLMSEED